MPGLATHPFMDGNAAKTVAQILFFYDLKTRFMQSQFIEETAHSLAIRSGWRRRFDQAVVNGGYVVAALIVWFYPLSIKVLGVAGPPVAVFGLLAFGFSLVRMMGSTRLFFSDLGINAERRILGFLRLKHWHIPRRQVKQAFVRAEFLKSKKVFSLHLLLADGQTLTLLQSLEKEQASHFEKKIESLLSIENQAVTGEEGRSPGWREGIFGYPEPPAEGALQPVSNRFEIRKFDHETLVIQEKWLTDSRIFQVGTFLLLVVVSVWLNGQNPFFWLLTAWPIFLSLRKIEVPTRLIFNPRFSKKNGSHLGWDLRPSNLRSFLVAPDSTKSFCIENYKLLLVNQAGERFELLRKLSLPDAQFLEKQLKIWFKIPDLDSRLEIKKQLETA